MRDYIGLFDYFGIFFDILMDMSPPMGWGWGGVGGNGIQMEPGDGIGWWLHCGCGSGSGSSCSCPSGSQISGGALEKLWGSSGQAAESSGKSLAVAALAKSLPKVPAKRKKKQENPQKSLKSCVFLWFGLIFL